MVVKMLLSEYRCKGCNKLLCKALLRHPRSVLEVKCRGCGNVSVFSGRPQPEEALTNFETESKKLTKLAEFLGGFIFLPVFWLAVRALQAAAT